MNQRAREAQSSEGTLGKMSGSKSQRYDCSRNCNSACCHNDYQRIELGIHIRSESVHRIREIIEALVHLPERTFKVTYTFI